MALNFPDSPTNGQVFNGGQRSWVWNGRAWQASTVTIGYTGSLGYTGSQGTIGFTGSSVTTLPVVTLSTAYSPNSNDNGALISITTGGVTVSANTWQVGQNFNIFNNNASTSQTITQGSSVTMYLAGMPVVTTGNRTLAPYGLASIVCVATNTFVITGAGVS